MKPLGRAARVGLTAASGVLAAIFAGAALAIPWQRSSWWFVGCAVLALGHAVTAGLAAVGLRRTRPLELALRVSSLLSLLAAGVLSWVALSSSLYLIELYTGIGRLLTIALCIVWLLALVLTLPIGLWGIGVTWASESRARRRWTWLLALGFALVAVSAIFAARSARATPLHAHADGELERTLNEAWQRELRTAPQKADDIGAGSLFTPEPATCARPIAPGTVTAIATYKSDASVRHICVQAARWSELLGALQPALRAAARGVQLVKLDVLSGAQRLSSGTLIDPLKLRPALDGACMGQRCLAPWQLVALDAFTQFRPFAAVRDASFGFSMDWLQRTLGAAGDTRPVRIETSSWVLDRRGVSRLTRLRSWPQPLEPGTVERAVRRAEAHILESQVPSGEFRYLLDPFRGTAQVANFTIPRHAGTLLVLCELGQSPSASAAIARAVEPLIRNERRVREASALSKDPLKARLGHTALPLAALLSCRPRIGERQDALIARLGQSLLRMQREDGSFYPELDVATATPRGAHEALYSAGQAVLALVLLEQTLPRLSERAGLTQAPLARAIERAMAYYSGPYWRGPLYDVFFLEENWHCLAARAALASRRHDAYERFCLDYVRFKARFILGAGEADADLLGGYGITGALPVHNTPTAGFGEAMSAAISVKRARGLATQEDEALLGRALGFLLASQWEPVSCFACASTAVLGGYSEHYASPPIRIDYVQHAMAALGHGARVMYSN